MKFTMLSLTLCKNTLNKNNQGKKYSEEEVKQIREVLTNLATIDFEKFKQKKVK